MLDRDALDPFSRRFADALFATIPTLLPHARAVRGVLEVECRPGAPRPDCEFWISTDADEVTVGFGIYHRHFDWPLHDDDPLAFVQSLMADATRIEDRTRDGIWTGSSSLEPGEEPDTGELDPDQVVYVRSWSGARDVTIRGQPAVGTAATLQLWHAVGLDELRAIAASGWRRLPSLRAGQTHFEPACDASHAVRIAAQQLAQAADAGDAGFVLTFALAATDAAQFTTRTLDDSHDRLLCVPAAAFDAFAQQLVGPIRVVRSFYGERFTAPIDAVTRLPTGLPSA